MTQWINALEGDDDSQNYGSVKKEIENLRKLKTLDQNLPQMSELSKLMRSSMTIDLRLQKGLRDSWKKTIEEVDLSQSLKNDESYQRIMQSKSEEDLTKQAR